MPPRYSCRACSSTSYKQVIARDAQGQMRPSGLYACSGCSAVFANPDAWRTPEAMGAHAGQRDPAAQSAPDRTQPLNFKTGWIAPPAVPRGVPT